MFSHMPCRPRCGLSMPRSLHLSIRLQLPLPPSQSALHASCTQTHPFPSLASARHLPPSPAAIARSSPPSPPSPFHLVVHAQRLANAKSSLRFHRHRYRMHRTGPRVVSASRTASRLATDLRAPLQLAHACIDMSIYLCSLSFLLSSPSPSLRQSMHRMCDAANTIL